MQDSHLISVIKTLEKAELRQLKKWLRSPIHNQREDVLLLFEYLIKKLPLDNEKGLEKAFVFKQIFKKQPYDDALIRQTMHFLLKVIEDFLMFQEMMLDESRALLSLASVYRKRKLTKAYEKVYQKTQKSQKKTLFQNEHFLRNQYLIAKEQYAYLSNFKRIDLNLQEVSNSLDLTYFADKLRQTCLMIAHQTVYKTEYDTGLLEAVIHFIEGKRLYEQPAIGIYYYIYKTLSEGEEAHFFALKKQINSYLSVFPTSEKRDVYLLAINYCIKSSNSGKPAFIREAFELYRHGLEEQFLIENDYISTLTFRNVITYGLSLKEYEWIDHFINSYQKYLDKKVRNSIIQYSRAMLFYEKKQYDKAMPLLVALDYDDILMTLKAKLTLLKIYYEEEEYDALESLLESMRVYLRRKKVVGYHRDMLTNVINLTRELVRINPFDKQERSQLKIAIETASPLTTNDQQWLLQQLKNL